MVRFGGPDVQALHGLGQFTRGFYLSERLSGEANDRALRFIRAEYLERGTRLFGRETLESLDEFRQAAGGALDGVDDGEIYRILCFAVQRIRNYSHILSIAHAGIYELIRIVAIFDERTSELCRFLDGKYVRLKPSTVAVQRFTHLTPEEYAEEFVRSESAKAYAADPIRYMTKGGCVGDLIDDSIVLEGRGLPPYHPRCRTRVEAVLAGAIPPKSGAEQAAYDKQKSSTPLILWR